MYNRGYCMAVIEELNSSRYDWLREISTKCKELILGIPDELVMARIFGDRPYNPAECREYMLGTGWFADVVILDGEHLRYPAACRTYGLDAVFTGTEYGLRYGQDLVELVNAGVQVVSLAPTARVSAPAGGSLRIALEGLRREQKIVLFGTGAYFDAYMAEYGGKFAPVYAIDNDETKWGTQKAGIPIKNPDVLKEEHCDEVVVILCCRAYADIRKQILSYGAFEYRTMLMKNEISLLEEFGIAVEKERYYLRDSHRILNELMKEFDAVCQKYGIHYYLICGTLIGAVRHKGMIPWDDDIDIAIPRADYKKLKRIAKKIWGKQNDTFRFVDYMDVGGHAFLDCMPRVYYVKEHVPTKCFDKVYGKADKLIENRMFLDLYVMDNAHVNEKVHNFVTNVAMKGIYNLMMGHRAYLEYDEYVNMLTEKEFRLMVKVHRIGAHIPLGFLAFWYDAFSRSGNWNRKAPDVIMESCAIRCIELKYPKAHFGEGQRVPFEDYEVMIPSDYDGQLLDMRYRNYMEFPRMSIRKPSHYFNSDIEIW